jgi:hypothetical protein
MYKNMYDEIIIQWSYKEVTESVKQEIGVRQGL